MVLYTLTKINFFGNEKKILEIVVPDEQRSDRCRFPYRIYEAAKRTKFLSLKRKKDTIIIIYRGTDVVYYGKVENLKSPEYIYEQYRTASLKRDTDISSEKLKKEYETFLCDQRISK